MNGQELSAAKVAQLRTSRLHVVMTKAERKTLNAAAKAARTTPSKLIRNWIDGGCKI